MVNEESFGGSELKPLVRIVAWTFGGGLGGALPGVLMLIGDISEGHGLKGDGMFGPVWILFVAVGRIYRVPARLFNRFGLGVIQVEAAEGHKLRRKKSAPPD